jgi:hypothetical protein
MYHDVLLAVPRALFGKAPPEARRPSRLLKITIGGPLGFPVKAAKYLRYGHHSPSRNEKWAGCPFQFRRRTTAHGSSCSVSAVRDHGAHRCPCSNGSGDGGVGGMLIARLPRYLARLI